jgi:hypothetical protein
MRKNLKQTKMKCKALIVGSFLLLSSLCASAGEPSPEDLLGKTELNGSVFHQDNHKPLRDVTITAYSAQKKEMSVTTDASGNYYFDGLKSGTYRFVFERNGYRKVTKEKVVIRSDEGFQLNIGLAEEEEFHWLPGAFQLLGGEK